MCKIYKFLVLMYTCRQEMKKLEIADKFIITKVHLNQYYFLNYIVKE